MPADDAVAVGGAVNARVQQVRAHKFLWIRDRIRARADLTVGRFLGRDCTRRNHSIAGCSDISLTPPRLIETARVVTGSRTAVSSTAIVIAGGVSP